MTMTLSGKKKKKKKKTKRLEGRRSQEAKAIATSKIVVNLPEFTGKDLSEFAENFGRFLRMTGQSCASGQNSARSTAMSGQFTTIHNNSLRYEDVA